MHDYIHNVISLLILLFSQNKLFGMKKKNNSRKTLLLQSKKLLNSLRENQGIRGISVAVDGNRNKLFRATLTYAGVKYALGYHDTPQDAAMAYNEKAKKLFKTERKAREAGYWNNL